jgi:hypothetical protein
MTSVVSMRRSPFCSVAFRKWEEGQEDQRHAGQDLRGVRPASLHTVLSSGRWAGCMSCGSLQWFCLTYPSRRVVVNGAPGGFCNGL